MPSSLFPNKGASTEGCDEQPSFVGRLMKKKGDREFRLFDYNPDGYYPIRNAVAIEYSLKTLEKKIIPPLVAAGRSIVVLEAG